MRIEVPWNVGDVVWVLHRQEFGGWFYEPMCACIKQINIADYGSGVPKVSYAVEEKIYMWFDEVFATEEEAVAAAAVKNQIIGEETRKLRLRNYRDRIKSNNDSIKRLKEDNEQIENKLKEMEENK